MKRTLLKTYSIQRVKETSHYYNIEENAVVRSPDDAVNVFRTVFNTEGMTKEHFLMASLNTKNKVTALHVVHVGSVNASVVDPRDVFQLALLDDATSIVVAHNHPSGDPSPSQEDISATKKLNEAGKLIGIELIDHLVIGDGSHVSIKEQGHI